MTVEHPSQQNWQRLKRRFASADRTKSRWLVECRDLDDSLDTDAGVYLVECPGDKGVDELVRRCSDDSSNRVLGIFDLLTPFEEQVPGISSREWLER